MHGSDLPLSCHQVLQVLDHGPECLVARIGEEAPRHVPQPEVPVIYHSSTVLGLTRYLYSECQGDVPVLVSMTTPRRPLSGVIGW